jgi:hypothetical protein
VTSQEKRAEARSGARRRASGGTDATRPHAMRSNGAGGLAFAPSSARRAAARTLALGTAITQLTAATPSGWCAPAREESFARRFSYEPTKVTVVRTFISPGGLALPHPRRNYCLSRPEPVKGAWRRPFGQPLTEPGRLKIRRLSGDGRGPGPMPSGVNRGDAGNAKSDRASPSGSYGRAENCRA